MILKKFEEQAAAFPDNIAVNTGMRNITYYDLNNLGNQLANVIISRDSHPDGDSHRVSLLFEHGADMIISVIGSLKAGKTYVPLDIYNPEKRLAFMVENSGSYLILTNSANIALAQRLAGQMKNKIDIIDVNSINMTASSLVKLEKEVLPDGNRLAYILYTSGSTGKPKGVMQTHRNVLYFTDNWIQRFSITESDRLTFVTSFSHDQSIQDIYAALLSGATLYPYSLRYSPNTYEFYNLIMKEKITIWHSVPSFFRYFTSTLTVKDLFYDFRWILLGGESIRDRDFQLYKTHFPKACLGCIYGQTESSVNTSCTLTHEDSFDDMTLGQPLEKTRILVVGENGELVETMGVGEIVVASDYIALGYWGDKEHTEEVFDQDEEFGRIYWTGDLGRITADNSIKMMGRKDFQVKIRGFRVETGEIESILLCHKLVKEAVIIAKKDENDDDYLCAYITVLEHISSSKLREFLADELPDYMVPRYFIPLENIPVTSSGKIDRAGFPEPEDMLTREMEYEPPTTETEKKLTDIWQEVLQMEKIGVYDNFIEMGGHSLLVISIIAKIHQVFNVELQLGDVFENPTIKELSRLIAASKETVFSSIAPSEKKEYYAATPDQEQMLILDRFENIGITYNLTTAMELEGEIQLQYLENVFQKLIQRHEAFRTSFEMIKDKLVQIIHNKVDFKIDYIDAEKDGPVDQNEINKIVKNFIHPFDLSKPVLLRVSLAKLSSNRHLLLVDKHHIISDGTSEVILFSEFIQLYTGQELPVLTLRYRDYSEWQNRLSSSSQAGQQEEYWLNRFSAEIPVLNLPIDYPRPAVQEFAGGILVFRLTKEVTEGIHQLVTETGSTLFMVLLAMLNIFLYKYTGQEDIVIGSIVAGRDHVELENVVGLFIKTLALRNYPEAHKSFRSFLQEVKDNTLKALESQHYPFSRLVEKLNLKKDPSRNPLFDVTFILQNSGIFFKEKSEQEISLKSNLIGHGNTSVKFDLAFEALEFYKGMILTIQYRTKLFKRDTIELMRDRLLVLIESILNQKDTQIRELDYSVSIEKEKANLQEVDFDL